MAMLAAAAAVTSIVLAEREPSHNEEVAIFVTHFRGGQVQRSPTAVVSSGPMPAPLSSACGMVPVTVMQGWRELELLSHPARRPSARRRN
jgi:hypothetical protein